MTAIASSVLPIGAIGVAIDTASAVVVAMVLGAVVLVFWASRPSVITRYSVDKTRAAAAPRDPSAPAPPASNERDLRA